MPAAPHDPNHGLIISYLTLRKWVGILGIALPFVLILGYNLFDEKCQNFPPSISHFYYTDLGNVFVGTLCAVALFMFSYNGHDWKDKLTAKIAGVSAILVAMFPTDFNAFSEIICSRITRTENPLFNNVHYVSAAVLFACLAFFCLFQFTQTNRPGPMPKPKRRRNSIYRICGWIIIICITSIAVIGFTSLNEILELYKPTFLLETIALIAFGLSWLTKGEMFFKDK